MLIAGGRDKGVDLAGSPRRGRDGRRAPCSSARAARRSSASCADAGVARTTRAATLDEAVATADAFAHDALADRPAGTVATVLLSPAAASFDMFEDYAARGRAFIAAVGRRAEGR